MNWVAGWARFGIGMDVIQANNIRMVYGADEIFRGVSFSVKAGERIGIVGANGAGKSTLLNMIAGELEPTGGNLAVSGDLKTGYLKQGREGIPGVFSGGFGGDDKSGGDGGYSGGGSGGEYAKRALEAILSGLPDILLLDEPTNHLDFERLAWLEGRIRHFKGTILLVSHDRYFLDRVVSRIFDMGGGSLKAYNGNYSVFRKKKAALTEAAERAYQKDLAEYKRQKDMIRHMKERGTEKLAKRAASREKKLLRERRPEAVRAHDSEGRRVRIRFTESRRSGDDVLLAENLEMSFGPRRLFENVGFDIKRGETVCMVGANGVGKTTLFRILAGKADPGEGYFERGFGVRIGYYDQHQENLTQHRTLIDEMREAFPLLDDTEHRRRLGTFLFSGDKVFQQIGTLSGGEKARLSLLKLIHSGANTLLLDEPTNHLDIASMEVVEGALKDFPGTLFIISHDRYLLETLPDRIVELTPYGLDNYPGKFDYYFEKRAELASARKTITDFSGNNQTIRERDHPGTSRANVEAGLGFSGNSRTRGGKAHPGAVKEANHGLSDPYGNPESRGKPGDPQSRQDTIRAQNYKPETDAARERRLAKEAETAVRRRERRIAETEEAIDKAEKKIASLEAALTDHGNATNHELLARLYHEFTETEKAIGDLLAMWEELHRK